MGDYGGFGKDTSIPPFQCPPLITFQNKVVGALSFNKHTDIFSVIKYNFLSLCAPRKRSRF